MQREWWQTVAPTVRLQVVALSVEQHAAPLRLNACSEVAQPRCVHPPGCIEAWLCAPSCRWSILDGDKHTTTRLVTRCTPGVHGRPLGGAWKDVAVQVPPVAGQGVERFVCKCTLCNIAGEETNHTCKNGLVEPRPQAVTLLAARVEQHPACTFGDAFMSRGHTAPLPCNNPPLKGVGAKSKKGKTFPGVPLPCFSACFLGAGCGKAHLRCWCEPPKSGAHFEWSH